LGFSRRLLGLHSPGLLAFWQALLGTARDNPPDGLDARDIDRYIIDAFTRDHALRKHGNPRAVGDHERHRFALVPGRLVFQVATQKPDVVVDEFKRRVREMFNASLPSPLFCDKAEIERAQDKFSKDPDRDKIEECKNPDWDCSAVVSPAGKFVCKQLDLSENVIERDGVAETNIAAINGIVVALEAQWSGRKNAGGTNAVSPATSADPTSIDGGAAPPPPSGLKRRVLPPDTGRGAYLVVIIDRSQRMNKLIDPPSIKRPGKRTMTRREEALERVLAESQDVDGIAIVSWGGQSDDVRSCVHLKSGTVPDSKVQPCKTGSDGLLDSIRRAHIESQGGASSAQTTGTTAMLMPALDEAFGVMEALEWPLARTRTHYFGLGRVANKPDLIMLEVGDPIKLLDQSTIADYGFNSIWFDDKYLEEIKKRAGEIRDLKAHNVPVHVEVYGRSDSVGSPEAKHQTARIRANIVKWHLENYGVDSRLITIRPRSGEPATPDQSAPGGADERQARRVEIYVRVNE
jgi:outer membrane protein OmpA-like peptidoglycan-associated protein